MSFPMRRADGGWLAPLGGGLTWRALDLMAAALSEHARRNVPGRRSALIGFDGRFSGEILAERLAAAFQREGMAADLQAKPGPSAALSQAVRDRRAALGVLLSGGSAAPEINGAFVRSESGGPLSPPRLERVQRRLDELAEADGPAWAGANGNGFPGLPVPRADFLEAYFEGLCRVVDFEAVKRLPPTRLAVDAMHGTARRYLSHLLADTPVEVVPVRWKPDPLFGGGAPDPFRPEALGPLREAIRSKRCSWGCAFNGDASRAAILDSSGELLPPSTLLAVAFEHLVKERRAKGSLVRARATDPLLDRVAESLGRRCLETSSGWDSLARQASQGGVALAGDHAGAVAFGGGRPFDSEPFLLVLLLLEMSGSTGVSVEGLAADLERRFWPARSAHRELSGSAEFLRERFGRLVDDPPAKVGSTPTSAVSPCGENELKLSMRDGSWLLIRLAPDGEAAFLDAGAQSDRRARQALDEGASLLLGSPPALSKVL